MTRAKILLFMVIVGLGGPLFGGPSQAATTHPMDWELPLLTGQDGNKSLSISDYRGRIVYVDFWASWCRPCLISMPFLDALQKEFGDRGFQVVAVNVDHDKGDAIAFLGRHPVDYPVVHAPDGQLMNHLQVVGLPTVFLLEASGEVTLVHVGFKRSDKAFIRAVVDRALAKNQNQSRE